MIMEGQITNQIYTWIKYQEYVKAINILNIQLESNPRSRAALSPIGYCNYLTGNYDIAADMYDQLSKSYSNIVEYRIYLAQAFYINLKIMKKPFKQLILFLQITTIKKVFYNLL